MLKKHLLTLIAVFEAVLIAVLALVLFLPKGEKKLSELSREKQFEYIRSTGVEWEEKYDLLVLEAIKNYERDPYYEYQEAEMYLSFNENYGSLNDSYDYSELVEKVQSAVNGYYGRNIEE